MKRNHSRKQYNGKKVAGACAALSLGTLATASLGAASLGAMPAANAATTTTAAATPTWHVVGAIPGDPSGQVAAVVPTGETSGYAFTNGTAKVPAAYERTGATTWKQIAFPGNSSETVVAAQASSAGNVWAFENNSANGESVALKLVNGNWVAMKTFPEQIGGISVLSSTEVWVYGERGTSAEAPLGVYDFDGSAWHKVAATLQGGGEVGIDDIWGYSGTIAAHYVAGQWTGTDLAPLLKTTATDHPAIYHVLSLSDNNVYAVGVANDVTSSEPVVILHFNGTAWSKVAVSSVHGFPAVLAPDGEGGLWISVSGTGYSTMLHYSDGEVTQATLPGTSGTLGAVAGLPVPTTTFELAGGSSVTTPEGGPVAEILQYS